ncbi:MAG: response regulator [Pseudomonadota bacterium]
MTDLPLILLVEDNKDDYEAAFRSLRKNNFANPIHWCPSGQAALDFLYRRGEYEDAGQLDRPGLIMLDLNMPGIDGRQVLETIKGDAELRSIPIVVLTTSADPGDVEKCYDSGASTYIQKPVSFEALTEAIGTMKDYWFRVAILPKHSMKSGR